MKKEFVGLTLNFIKGCIGSETVTSLKIWKAKDIWADVEYSSNASLPSNAKFIKVEDLEKLFDEINERRPTPKAQELLDEIRSKILGEEKEGKR